MMFLLSPIVALIMGRTIAQFRHTVPEGYVAIKRRMGRIVYRRGMPVIYKGGYLFCIPGVHAPEMYHESNNPLEIKEQILQLNDGLYEVSALVIFGVTDMCAAALADTKHVKEIMEKFAQSVILDTLRGKRLRHLQHCQAKLVRDLNALCNVYGVTIHKFKPRAVPTVQTEAALIMQARAKNLSNALNTLDVKPSDVDPSVLVAAVAGQPVSQVLPPRMAAGTSEDKPDSAGGLGQIYSLPHQARN